MSKIICDVCGTEYPETAELCPICGTARAAAQTSAADTAPEEETAGYTYVKGGRFSKSNVRKRLRANQDYEDEKPVPVTHDAAQDEDEEDEDDYEGPENGSNRSLIVVVILLLLAIIAVSSYIAINYLGLGDDPADTTAPNQSQTDPTAAPGTTGPSESGNPCLGLTTTDRSIELKTKGGAWLLNVAVEPANTTDPIVYTSSDPNVATVDSDGLVTAVGPGEAVITITCGKFSAECAVQCTFETEPAGPTEPGTDVTDPTFDPNETYTVKFNGQTSRWGNDTTINAGTFFNLTLENSQNEEMDVVWVVDKPEVCSVNGKVVTGLSNGNATLTTTFAGVKYTCIVRVKGGTTPTEPPATEAPQDPTEAPDPETPTEEPTEAPTAAPTEEPGEVYIIHINGMIPTYGNGTNLVDNTENVGAKFTLTVENDMGARMPVEWVIGNEEICAMDGNKVECLAAGTTKLTAVYEGVTYEVTLRIVAPAE